MGQDIHTHAFLMLKSENRYVDVRELFSEYGFPDLVRDRYYDLFSLFGSTRSCYPHLDGIKFGIPDEAPILFRTSMSFDPDYHTFSWMHLSDLKRSIEDYISCIENPSKFIVRNPDMNEDEKRLIISMFSTGSQEDNPEGLKYALKDILARIREIYDTFRFYPDEVKSLVDLDRTIVCFWFDN